MSKSINPLLLLGLGIAGASYLSKQENREKVMDLYRTAKERVVDFLCDQNPSACQDLLDKAGNPDPHDLGDTRMVGEGAMYAVDYYNKEEQQE
ncbi:hypothetical protein KHA96_14195 [Bacillus sp. FJAT-49711]|uniref:hypothetical protein n=1 Tax=Bacillus sp. FJAT-49711 TaxID=2833585 RepID=UPI001BC9355A|nr:hypothetical protein [Bacillus sp. FJAT-49711]MBS4219465.1 hypothetical protein [Bacillus sp. FJAT-49711]